MTVCDGVCDGRCHVSGAAADACGVRKVREVRRRGNRVGDQTDHGASDGDVGEELRCLETCELACVQLRGGGKRKNLSLSSSMCVCLA